MGRFFFGCNKMGEGRCDFFDWVDGGGGGGGGGGQGGFNNNYDNGGSNNFDNGNGNNYSGNYGNSNNYDNDNGMWTGPTDFNNNPISQAPAYIQQPSTSESKQLLPEVSERSEPK